MFGRILLQAHRNEAALYSLSSNWCQHVHNVDKSTKAEWLLNPNAMMALCFGWVLFHTASCDSTMTRPRWSGVGSSVCNRWVRRRISERKAKSQNQSAGGALCESAKAWSFRNIKVGLFLPTHALLCNSVCWWRSRDCCCLDSIDSPAGVWDCADQIVVAHWPLKVLLRVGQLFVCFFFQQACFLCQHVSCI